MLETRTHLVLMALAIVPYAAVAWVYMSLVNGGAGDFWIALGVVIGVRLCFAVIEGLGAALSWRLYTKKVLVQKFIDHMRLRQLPKRKFAEEGFTEYVSRLEDDPKQPDSVKRVATEFRMGLEIWETSGIFTGMRMHAAAEAAFDAYSPKAEAPSMYAA